MWVKAVTIVTRGGSTCLRIALTDWNFPAYDIVTTSVYIENETKIALNLGKTKERFKVTTDNFQWWANKSGIPLHAIKPHLDDTMEKARSLWPDALKDLPMDETHKKALKTHWQNLQADFKIWLEKCCPLPLPWLCDGERLDSRVPGVNDICK